MSDERKWYGSHDGGSEYGHPEDSRAEAITEALGDYQDLTGELKTGAKVLLHVGRGGAQASLSVGVDLRVCREIVELAHDRLYDDFGEEATRAVSRCFKPKQPQLEDLMVTLKAAVREWEDRHGLRPSICEIDDVELVEVVPTVDCDGEIMDWVEVVD